MKTRSILKFFLLAIPLIGMITLFSKCKKDDNNSNGSGNNADATISGKVYSPSGIALGAVEVLAGQYKTMTDHTGSFTLKVAPGSYTLIFQTGKGHIFKTEQNVTVVQNQVINIEPVESVLKQTQTLAYIPGNYDHIETIVIDTLGYSATMISMNDLSNLSSITPFAAIFMNCGLLEMSGVTMDSTKYANLQAYMVGLGSLYASDFAVECLTGDGHLKPAPVLNYSLSRTQHGGTGGNQLLGTCISPMLGGFLEDSCLCTLKSGITGMIIGAQINDANIVTLLGHSTIDLYYDLGGWEVISLVDPPFTTVITDTQSNGPLAVTTDFNDETPGGVIFYTTFHNEPQGTVSQDMNQILQYFILNL
jgi:hypothetical protein